MRMCVWGGMTSFKYYHFIFIPLDYSFALCFRSFPFKYHIHILATCIYATTCTSNACCVPTVYVSLFVPHDFTILYPSVSFLIFANNSPNILNLL